MFVSRSRREGYDCEPLVVITAGFGHRQERVDRPEGADVYHVLYIEEGEGIIEDGIEKYRLFGGTAVFIPKKLPVSYYSLGGEMKTAWITFVGKVADLLAEHYGADKKIAICEGSTLFSAIIECAAILRRGLAEERLTVSAYAIITDFFNEERENKSSSYLIKAKRYMADNYKKDLSVSDIAEAAGVSESLLYRKFREEEGESPIICLRRLRLDHAGRMLLGGSDIRISSVARSCGFSDCAYFCRVFKEHYGLSPREYRRKNEI
jgi:AraC-like DNA-binding protein